MVFSMFYLLYWLIFSRLTFHSLNRLYLLFSLLFSLVCPIIPTSGSFIQTLKVAEIWSIINKSESIYFADFVSVSLKPIIEQSATNWIAIVYVLVLGFLFIRFIGQMWYMVRFCILHGVFFNGNRLFYLRDANIRPFSFFRWIFIPEILRYTYEGDVIIKHEEVHCKQGHTFDLIAMELYCIVFWFNPLVFHSRRSFRMLHEYLADEKAAKSCKSMVEYLQLIVSSTEMQCVGRFSHSFNSILIKKRINMITKNKSIVKAKYAYFLSIPILVVALFFAARANVLAQTPSTNVSSNALEIPVGYPMPKDAITHASGYGMRIHPITKKMIMHNAIDFAAKKGTDVFATAAGKVVSMGLKKESHGRYILIDHGNGFSTFYTHLDMQIVKEGDIVKRGQVIGKVGNTGLSTGSHLHYEVLLNGVNVDPSKYLE